MITQEQRISNALAPFNLTCDPMFWQLYHKNIWVFNLGNVIATISNENQILSAENKLMREALIVMSESDSRYAGDILKEVNAIRNKPEE